MAKEYDNCRLSAVSQPDGYAGPQGITPEAERTAGNLPKPLPAAAATGNFCYGCAYPGDPHNSWCSIYPDRCSDKAYRRKKVMPVPEPVPYPKKVYSKCCDAYCFVDYDLSTRTTYICGVCKKHLFF